MDSNPPFERVFKTLLENPERETKEEDMKKEGIKKPVVVDGFNLPVINLDRLNSGGEEKQRCKKEIVEASVKWGFFQVTNHGISRELLEKLRKEQVKLFREPFEKKANQKLLNFAAESYRWGAPLASSLQQFSWSEAFHIPLSTMEGLEAEEFGNLRSTVEEFAIVLSKLAHTLAEVLTENLGGKSSYFVENCSPRTCYLRLNRYPPCPISPEVYGLMPHTDSDFLTIVYQDQVGGLQLLKDERWITVNPNPDSLIINIGDLFQAWSNGAYKSIEHRVMTNPHVERFSVAYFMCPSYDTVIESCIKPSIYKKFSFKEFRQQVQEDVRTTGYKVGLPRFLI